MKPKELGRDRASFVERWPFQAGRDHGLCLSPHLAGEHDETGSPGPSGQLLPYLASLRGILGSFFAGPVLPLQQAGSSEKWRESVVKWEDFLPMSAQFPEAKGRQFLPSLL